MIPNPDNKATPLFDVEYLINDRRHTHGYYGILPLAITLCDL